MTLEKFIFIVVSVVCSGWWKTHSRKAAKVCRAPLLERGEARGAGAKVNGCAVGRGNGKNPSNQWRFV
jgi:hypothetical protein